HYLDEPKVRGGWMIRDASKDARVPQGGALSVAGNLQKYFGAEADVSGHYESKFKLWNDSTHLFLFGPKAAIRPHTFTPGGHVLFGTAVVRARAQSSSGLGPADRRESAAHFAWAVGGGLDFSVRKTVAIRTQADNIRNNLSLLL